MQIIERTTLMAKDIKTYYEQLYIDNTLRLREILSTLPSFVRDYFRAIEPATSSKTRISYAYDLRVFFNFLIENNPVLNREKKRVTQLFNIFKDSDNLDRVRLGLKDLDMNYLRNPESKHLTKVARMYLENIKE